MKESLLKKQSAVKKQLSALLADAYRITLQPRRDYLPPVNFGNDTNSKQRKLSGEAEKFLSAAELMSEEVLSVLSSKNVEGYDIYVTPISENKHFILVDDSSHDKIVKMEQDGYTCALTQKSSAKNRQAVIIIPKIEISKIEQSAANKFLQKINFLYGDKKITGVRHPFRLAGYYNKKLGREGELASVVTATGKSCGKAEQELEDIRKVQLAFTGARGAAGGGCLLLLDPSDNKNAMDEYTRRREQTLRIVAERNLPVDQDKIDTQIARGMLGIGYSENQTANAILKLSSQIHTRYKNPKRYASMTVTFAKNLSVKKS